MKTITKEQELQNCTFVKTILMILVVAAHSLDFWTGTWFTKNPAIQSPLCVLLSELFNHVHTYGFVLVSGYIFSYLKLERSLKMNGGGYNEFGLFALNKAKRLLVPYTFVSIFWVIPIAGYFLKYNIDTVMKNFALGMAPGQLWFLLMLFDVFIIFWFISDFLIKHDKLGGIIVLVFYGFGTVGQMLAPNIFQFWTACQYLTFFWLGFIIRKNGNNMLKKIPGGILIVIYFALFTVLHFVPSEGVFYLFLSRGIAYLLHIVGALMIFDVLQKIASKFNWQESRFFSLLSKRSMAIYLFHQQVIYFTIVWLNGAINPFLHATVNFLVSMLFSLLVSGLLMKFKWTRVLIGEKQ